MIASTFLFGQATALHGALPQVRAGFAGAAYSQPGKEEAETDGTAGLFLGNKNHQVHRVIYSCLIICNSIINYSYSIIAFA